MNNSGIERVRSTEIAAHIGKRVELQGWLHAVRRLGGVAFVIVRDGWGMAQAVAEEAGQLASIVDGEVQPESVIRLSGIVTEAPQAPGGVELHQPEVEIVTPVTEPLPVLIGKKEIKAALNTQLDHAVFVNRHPTQRAVFRLGAGVMSALAERGLSEEPFASYLETFRYVMPPHGGFAIGLERLLMQLIGAPNLRLTTLFPRDLNRLTP